MNQWKRLVAWLREEDARDVIEYALILAFVMLASGALLLHSSDSAKGVWTNANNVLAQGPGGSGDSGLTADEQGVWNYFQSLGGGWQDSNPVGNNYAFGTGANGGLNAYQQFLEGLFQGGQMNLYNQYLGFGQGVYGGALNCNSNGCF